MRYRMTEPSWELLRSFQAVAATGSLTAAAVQLGTTQPTVGRHVAALEDELGVPLIVRHARGVELTAEGREMRDRLAPAAEQISAAIARVRGGREALRGVARISATEIVATHILMPRLARIRAELPRVALEIDLQNRFVDLLRGDADIAIRMQQPEQADLIARHVGDLPVGLYASRDYVERHGAPGTWDEVFDHDLIGFDRHIEMVRALASVDPRLTRDAHVLRTDSIVAQFEAVRAGLGLCGLQVGIASGFPDLVRVLPDNEAARLPLWVCMHRELRRGAVVRAVYTSLCETLAEYAATAPR